MLEYHVGSAEVEARSRWAISGEPEARGQS